MPALLGNHPVVVAGIVLMMIVVGRFLPRLLFRRWQAERRLAVFDRVCGMPREARARGNVSMRSLLTEVCYREHRNEISVEALHEYFACNPERVVDWMGHSDDQRCSEVWYIVAEESTGLTRVGFSPKGPLGVDELYEDRSMACAIYVKRYLEALLAIPPW